MQSTKIYVVGIFVLWFIHGSFGLLDTDNSLQKAIAQLNSTFQQTVADLRQSNAILNATVQQSAAELQNDKNAISAMNTTIQNSANVISAMNTTIQKSAVELQNAKNDIATMNRTILKSGAELQIDKNAISTMNTTIQNFEMKISALEQEVHRLEQGATPSIIFYAYLSSLTQVGPDQTIEFDKVLTNEGNAYDPRHGHFTAPVHGYYHLFATVMSGAKEYLYASFVKNGAPIAWLYCGYLDNQSSSQSINIQLAAGDMVWLKKTNSGLHTLDTVYCSFSGNIISKIV